MIVFTTRRLRIRVADFGDADFYFSPQTGDTATARR